MAGKDSPPSATPIPPLADADLASLINANNKKFAECFGANDNMKALSELYTEDCRLMPTGVDVLIGREAVQQVFNGAHGAGVRSVALQSDELIGTAGDATATERGHYKMFDAAGNTADDGKYVVIWKLVDGTYHLYIDIFNSNLQK